MKSMQIAFGKNHNETLQQFVGEKIDSNTTVVENCVYRKPTYKVFKTKRGRYVKLVNQVYCSNVKVFDGRDEYGKYKIANR